MTTDPAPFLQFWGKARPAGGGGPHWHPVAFHSLDVACVAERLLRERSVAQRTFHTLVGTANDDVLSWLVAMVALHDIGKFARPFQAMVPELWPAVLGPISPSGYGALPHTAAGRYLWEDGAGAELTHLFGDSHPGVSRVLLASVFGHHGRPLASVLHRARFTGSAEADAAAASASALVNLFFSPGKGAPNLKPAAARRLSWWLAGFVSLSDWVGSNQTWFPYASPDALSLSSYCELARARAAVAVHEAGLVPPQPTSRRSFVELTAKEHPTPVQAWADAVDLAPDPQLIIIEDVTGSGKTEAAHILVHRFLASGRASGAYWAMPTQATANAMFERQRNLIRGLFTGKSGHLGPSLVLAHGQSQLYEGFSRTVVGETASAPSFGPVGLSNEELPSELACPAFLADDRRTAFLADVGAGTVDQALLGVLPSKFNTIRLLGLSEKVLVIDEAHAYDAYTQVELQRLLEFQAAMGGSAIVLSATLTAAQRQSLVAAWHEGAGLVRPGEVLSPIPVSQAMTHPFPKVSVTSAKARQVEAFALSAADHVTRSVPVRLIDSLGTAMQLLLDCARDGGCVAWIRNTVDSCNAAAAALVAQGAEVEVFHARFAQGDRQARERTILKFAGKDGEAHQRRGRVVVATQVIEQSLDLDFDLLVTDLAPIDLLIQRMGRLWRHRERDGIRPLTARCELIVLSPEPEGAVAPSWLDELLPGSRFVYTNAGILWRTARRLREDGRIDVPGSIRRQLEGVYDAEGPCPEGLQGAVARAEGRDNGSESAANYSALRVADGYHGDQTIWLDEVRAVTRLGDEQTTVRLARVRGANLLPWWDDDRLPLWHRWALSEVRVRTARIPWSAREEKRFTGMAIAARKEWGRFEQELPLLPLEPLDAEQYHGTLVADAARDGAVSRPINLRYSAARGLEFI